MMYLEYSYGLSVVQEALERQKVVPLFNEHAKTARIRMQNGFDVYATCFCEPSRFTF
jgi:hypothetical protein